MGCFSGHLMSSASDQKLFCEICSAFNCSLDEFVGEKVVSPSYSSAILAPPPTPVFLPGKSHGRKSLVGCSPSDRYKWDTTERLHFHFQTLEKEMATHSSVLALRFPAMGEPGGLPSMGSHRVGHD